MEYTSQHITEYNIFFSVLC